MYAGPPTDSSSFDRVSSSLSVTRSTGWLRSLRPIIFSKMRRCASRKKSPASMTSAAWLKAWLLIRIAPITHFSASRLCGRVRSMGKKTPINLEGRRQKREVPHFSLLSSHFSLVNEPIPLLRRHDRHLQVRGDVAVELDGHVVLAERLERVGE